MSNTETCSREAPAVAGHQAYRLIGGAGDRARAAGLADADWYTCPVPRATMKALMQRSDVRAIHFDLDDNGQLVGASGFGPTSGLVKEMRLVLMLVERGVSIAGELLANRDVKLKSLL